MATVEEIRDDIVKEFTNAKKEMVDALKDQEGDLKTYKETMDNTVQSIEKAESRFEEIGEQYEELKTRLDEFEAEDNRMLAGERASKSIGAQFVESDVYEQHKANKFTGKSLPFGTKSLYSGGGMTAQKALTSEVGTRYGQMGWMIEPQDLGLLEQIQQPLTLRGRIPSINTTSDSVTFIEELGFANVYTELDAAALSTATTIVVKSTAGIFVGQTIFLAAAATPTVKTSHTVTAVDLATRVVTLSAPIGTARAANDPVTATAIGMTPPGQQKPEASLLGLREVSYPVGTVAHYMVIHRQTLADAPQLAGIIDNRLLFGLAQSVEEQILYGNGQSPNLQGILNNPNIQVMPNVPAGNKDVGGVWRLDHVRRMITKAQISQLPPSDLMVHPNDWQEIELAKGTDNHYIWVVVTEGGAERLWRVNVNVTMSIRDKEALLGSFAYGAYMLDREDANVRVSDQHKDFFTSNMLAILAEERLGLAVVRPQAFIKGTFN